MKLYMIRHGQCGVNVSVSFGGGFDSPLTEKGRRDALMTRRLLEGIHFDAVYSSPLSRALDTARIALPGVEPEIRQELEELRNGSLAGYSVEECFAKYGESLRRDRQDRDFTAYGGESISMHDKRVAGFLKEMEAMPENSTAAAFCHEGTIHCALRCVLGFPLNVWQLHAANGSVSVFDYSGGLWHLEKWSMTE